MGKLQLLVAITTGLLFAGSTARGPLGTNGLRYYNLGGHKFVAKQGKIMRDWYGDRSAAHVVGSKTYFSNRDILTEWFPTAYKSQRYMPGMKPLWIELLVRPNFYSVQLLFSETFFNAANKRLFTIKINGKWYNDGRFTKDPKRATVIDIFRMAGGRDRPIVLTVHWVNGLKGSIFIELIPVKQNAFICGAITAPVRTVLTKGNKALWTAEGNANA